MGIVWVIEKPGRLESSLAGILHGDVAVRAFASIRNFLKLGRLSSLKPNAVVIAGNDFPGELNNLEQLIDIHWPLAQIVVVADEAPGVILKAVYIQRKHYSELPFIVQRLLNEEVSATSSFIEIGDLCLDLEGHRLRVLPAGEWLHLTLKEAQILRHLIKFQDRFLSHEDLCREIWKDVKVSPKSVSSHMSRLRANLSSSHFTIDSIYGGGYRLVNQANLRP